MPMRLEMFKRAMVCVCVLVLWRSKITHHLLHDSRSTSQRIRTVTQERGTHFHHCIHKLMFSMVTKRPERVWSIQIYTHTHKLRKPKHPKLVFRNMGNKSSRKEKHNTNDVYFIAMRSQYLIGKNCVQTM